jgi:hypothetical protein
MMNLRRSKQLVVLLALLGCTVLGSVILTGCGTTKATKMAQGAQILITSVNDGMQVWRDYVNAGKATASQIAKVKNADRGYTTAMHVLGAANEKLAVAEETNTADKAQLAADAETANQSVKDAESALLALLNQYIK